MGGEAEAVTQRRRKEAGSSRRAHDRERGKCQRNRCRTGSLAHDDVDAEVLHGEVEHFLRGAREAVNLVDEEDVALLETGQDRREITRVLDRGTGRQAQGCAHLRSDNHRERRLAESRRAREKNMIGARRTHARCVEYELQLTTHDALADELRQLLRAQRSLGGPLKLPGVGSDDTHRLDVETRIHLISHVRLPASREQHAAYRRRQARCPRASRWPWPPGPRTIRGRPAQR